MSHTCKNLLIRCMDFRLRGKLMRWIDESGLFDGGFDVIALGGSSKDLANESEQIKEYFLKHIDFSINLHKVENIVILHHSDCGAYAESHSFASKEEEKNKQLSDMKISKDIIEKRYKGVKILLVWADLKDVEGENITFEIVD